MGTRSRQAWKPDARGYYARQLGWKRTETGKIAQHKFILGTDLREAQRREAKLCEIWETFAASRPPDERLLWPDALLEIAKAVARGVAEMPVARRPGEMQFSYADRIPRRSTPGTRHMRS